MSTAPDPTHRPGIKPWIWALIIASAILLLTLVTAVGLIGLGVVKLASHEAPGPGAASTASGEIAVPQGIASDQPYIQYGDASQGDTVVDVYLDYLCPYCEKFHAANGEDLKAMAADDSMTVRLHVRPMLDEMSSPAGYSGRAANAALAVYDEDPEKFWVMDALLYDNQPGEGEAGLTDERLIELAHQAGASDAVDAKITGGAFIPYLEKVVEPEARAKDYGTPILEVNGVTHEADDIYTPGSLKAAIAGA